MEMAWLTKKNSCIEPGTVCAFKLSPGRWIGAQSRLWTLHWGRQAALSAALMMSHCLRWWGSHLERYYSWTWQGRWWGGGGLNITFTGLLDQFNYNLIKLIYTMQSWTSFLISERFAVLVSLITILSCLCLVLILTNELNGKS